MRKLQPYAIGVIFVLAGAMHFLKPRFYEAIVPPFLPAQRELVQISGVFELLGGFGVMLTSTRAIAGWGLIALLLAVFPANIYMVVDPTFERVAPLWALYARLPLQFVLIWWIYATCIAEPNAT
jgi:uncharacterized membrane protein